MDYHVLEPEVAGALGEHTVMDRSTHPPVVSKLHYELAGWLGDDLLESFPCFVVTARLAERIDASDLVGATLDSLELSIHPEADELFASRELPKFRWLRVSGEGGVADWGLAEDGRLVVSDRAMAILSDVQLKHCDVELFG